MKFYILAFWSAALVAAAGASHPKEFVTVDSSGKYFELDNKRYTFVGANYWYGVNLGAEKSGDRARLVEELD